MTSIDPPPSVRAFLLIVNHGADVDADHPQLAAVAIETVMTCDAAPTFALVLESAYAHPADAGSPLMVCEY
jgi:hypothetical protein